MLQRLAPATATPAATSHTSPVLEHALRDAVNGESGRRALHFAQLMAPQAVAQAR